MSFYGNDSFDAISVTNLGHGRFHVRLTRFDVLSKHLEVLTKVNQHLKEGGARWVSLKFKDGYNEIYNAQLRENGDVDYDGYQHVFCRANQFESFYTKNLSNLVNRRNVSTKQKPDKDGFTLVVNPFKESERKLAVVQKEIDQFCGEWKTSV